MTDASSQEWAAIDELAAALQRPYADPGDVFEDGLAHDLGLWRHPALSVARVRFINATDLEEADDG